MAHEPFEAFASAGVSISSVEICADDWNVLEATAHMRSWRRDPGDLLTLHHFKTRPDIGARLGDVAAVRAFFRTMVLKNGGGIVSVDVLDLAGLPGVRAIIKVPQKPAGTTYLASLTIPRRDFSFVVKVQCEELSDVGARERAIYGRFLVGPSFDPARPLVGWEVDPYDPTRRDKIMRNESEDERYDAQFPEHPLSRARGYLSVIEPSLRVGEEVGHAPGFFGPD